MPSLLPSFGEFRPPRENGNVGQVTQTLYADPSEKWQRRPYKTIKETIAIFEIDLPFVSSKWAWTSATRAKNFDGMYFVLGAANWQNEIMSEIKDKVTGYITQDAKRFSVEEVKVLEKDKTYIDTDYVFKKMCLNKLRCVHCHKEMTATWTLNRLDNAKAHVKGNVEFACLSCNCSLK